MRDLLGQSRVVTTNQEGIHPDLGSVVARHQASVWQRPVAAHTRAAFMRWYSAADRHGPRCILDMGCGTGHSTVWLGRQYPECHVVGVDRSAVRVGKTPALPTNAEVIQADMWDWARLSAEYGVEYKAVYCLYPNPYPKKSALRQRVWAHSGFGFVLSLTNHLVLATNWEIGAKECVESMRMYGWRAELSPYDVRERGARTRFEQKYHASGQPLWEVVGRG